jgi:GT2 family glycosyltransferase
MNKKLLVSIVVPTHNRKDWLLRLLESLLQQSLSAEKYEIIVVCDGVTDGTNEHVRSLCRQHSQLLLVERPQGGPAAARNSGARVAQGTFLAFTDDDCIASREWLEKLIEPMQRGDCIGVEGRTTTIASQLTPLTHQVESNGGSHVVPTCNAACLRAAFEQLGGFDEGFSFLNEDVDFAWRLKSLGTICYAPDALIIHPPRPETFAKKALWVRHLEGEFLLFSRNPGAYRKYRGRSPWVNIYWNVFVRYNLVLTLRAAFGDILLRGRPDYCAIRLAIMVTRMWLLIRLFPKFLSASRARAEGVRGESAAPRGATRPDHGELDRVEG